MNKLKKEEKALLDQFEQVIIIGPGKVIYSNNETKDGQKLDHSSWLQLRPEDVDDEEIPW